MSSKLEYNPTTFDSRNINALCLLRRSKDDGDGWRQVSDVLWRAIVPNMPPELVEKDEEQKRVRFSERGKIVMDYIA